MYWIGYSSKKTLYPKANHFVTGYWFPVRKGTNANEPRNRRTPTTDEKRPCIPHRNPPHDRSRLRRLVLYEALNKHPVGSNGLSRIVMAAFAREYSIRVFRDLVIHRLKLSPLSESLNGFLEALRPDLLVFPFAQQEFDRSWRQRESLWRFSIE